MAAFRSALAAELSSASQVPDQIPPGKCLSKSATDRLQSHISFQPLAAQLLATQSLLEAALQVRR